MNCSTWHQPYFGLSTVWGWSTLPYVRDSHTIGSKERLAWGIARLYFPGTLGIRLLYWEPGISIDILLAFGNYFHRCIQITEESCYWHHWTLHCLVVVGRRGPWPRVHNVGLSILSPGCKVQEYSPRILHIMYKFSQYAYLIYLIGITGDRSVLSNPYCLNAILTKNSFWKSGRGRVASPAPLRKRDRPICTHTLIPLMCGARFPIPTRLWWNTISLLTNQICSNSFKGRVRCRRWLIETMNMAYCHSKS